MEEFIITGMSCAACSARVEGAVKKVAGVTSCAVSLLTNSMTVEGTFSSADVISAVEKAGYGIGKKGEEAKKERSEEKQDRSLFSLVISALLLLALMYVSMGHMLSLPLPAFFTPPLQGLYQFLLSLVILVLHRKYFINGARGLVRGGANMDTLVSLGSGISFLYSTYLLGRMLLSPEEAKEILHSLYFESAAMILVLITVGKKLEAYSKGKTTSAIRSLQRLSPDTARVLVEGAEVEKRVDKLQKGDLVAIRPGENFPVDGVILEGEGAVDESALTGESLPVDKKTGDSVYTGTSNLSGYLVCRAEKVGGETTLARMIDRVIASGASKAPIARLADRVSAVFVPVILILSLITLSVHLLLGAEFAKALEHAIAVLVVSCPCALGLATPVAIMVGSGVAARHGVLFKTAESLEKAGKTKIAVLDKTGTVTEGKPSVSDVYCSPEVDRREFLSLAVSLEEKSAHPLAEAIVSYGKNEGIESLAVSEFSSRTGFGVEGIVQGEKVIGGKKEMLSAPLSEQALGRAEEYAREGKTPVFFEKGGTFLGILALSDAIKADSAEAIAELHKMGIRTVMITGDRQRTAEAIAKKAGIDTVYAEVLPEGKEELVRKLSTEGATMMVGDGINDAPALAAAELGVAIGGGMDVAMDASEVVLMQSRLTSLPFLVGLSRKTLKNIKENLFWAFCYNLVGIPLAAGVLEPLFGWSLTPMFGAAAMSVSSFLVVSNALRLNLYGEKKEKQRKIKKENKTMETVLKIEGMMCPHCEAHVKKALEALEGVQEAIPSHEKNEARVILSSPVPYEVLKETVEKEGYKVL